MKRILLVCLLVLGFTLMFSLAVSELVKPVYDLTISIGGVIQSLALSVMFLILATLHLRKLKLDSAEV